MVGNDIVDIKETLLTTNWRRKGFVEKVFHPCEQDLIQKSNHPFHTIWRMWSMKESSYKLLQLLRKDRFFKPHSILCELISPQLGFVYIEKLVVRTFTVANSKYIFTSSSLNDVNNMENNVFRLAQSDHCFQSKSVRQKLLDYVARKHDLQMDKLCIKKIKNSAVPFLFYNDQKLNASISLTHHGHYGAFSYMRHLD